MTKLLNLTATFSVSDLKNPDYDCIVVVAPDTKNLGFKELMEPLDSVIGVDKSALSAPFIVPTDQLPAKRIVFASTGTLKKDYDDVRCYGEAAEAGMKKALSAGSKSPMLFVHKVKFEEAGTVALLGAFKALYVPLETRESEPDRAQKALKLGVYGEPEKLDQTLKMVEALECGRIVSRDIGGSDPERMAAPRVEEYVRSIFPKDSNVKIEVVQGQSTFEKEYPCLAAVNRAASGVERHDGRVIWLTYEPNGKVDKTLMMVGKGITYDTGGADIKAGGIMAGMSRDKCGAADVAGFIKSISMLAPKNIKVVGAMAMVRNSVGSNCYVSDEIIKARSGIKIRVGNTDAEGRMAMVDVLCHMKEKALNEVNPHLMTLATLTGHAVLAVGDYTAIMDNGPARKEKTAQAIQETGDKFGDPFEISTMRREDFKFIKDKSGEFVQILQCNNAASSRTPRGHQFPGAFMHTVSGLDDHMMSSEKPLKYSHLDVAGSSGDLPDPTTGSTVVALAMHFTA